MNMIKIYYLGLKIIYWYLTLRKKLEIYVETKKHIIDKCYIKANETEKS